MRTERRLARLESVLRKRQPDLTVVMENIHDPHNVSAVLRSCDAAGVMGVQLVYTDTKFPDIGPKSSASAKKWVERRRFATIAECYARLRQEGFTILATHLGRDARSPFELDLAAKVAFVVGNEHAGVSDDAAAQADAIVQIPMAGMIESLNVSVATGVLLFEAVRQRLAKGAYDSPKYSDADLTMLLNQWALKE